MDPVRPGQIASTWHRTSAKGEEERKWRPWWAAPIRTQEQGSGSGNWRAKTPDRGAVTKLGQALQSPEEGPAPWAGGWPWHLMFLAHTLVLASKPSLSPCLWWLWLLRCWLLEELGQALRACYPLTRDCSVVNAGGLASPNKSYILQSLQLRKYVNNLWHFYLLKIIITLESKKEQKWLWIN